MQIQAVITGAGLGSRLGTLTENIPKCIIVDYFSDDVNVEDFKTGEPLDKQQLMVQYRRGGLLPPKSTRHYFDFNTEG